MKLRTFLIALVGAGLALAGTSATAADTYRVDPAHSTAIFRIKHLNASYNYGRFNDIEGTFTLDDGNPAACQIDITVKAASLDTHNPRRDQHVMGPDFLNVKQYPIITFKSTKFTPAGKDAYEVTGDLTLHGVTKPITVKVTRTGPVVGLRGAMAGLETNFQIKRSEYQVNGMLSGPMQVGDDVWLIVSVEGHRP